MAKLTVDEILAVDDLKRDTVDVPEWGGQVEVRELTAAEKHEVGALMLGPDGQPDFSNAGQLPVLAATYGLGLTREKTAAIGAKSGAVVERIAEKVLALSGMEASAVDAAADFLPDTRNGGSPSD